MATETRLLTAEEFWRLPDAGGKMELVDGEVRTMVPVGGEHGVLQATLGSMFRDHAKQHGGKSMVETGFILRRQPDLVRAPDVSWVSPGRVPTQDRDKFWPGAPDLAVEVVSPDDSAKEIEAKVLEYLAAGSQWAWVVYPATRAIHVYRPGGAARVYSDRETIEAPDAPDGLTVALAEVLEG